MDPLRTDAMRMAAIALVLAIGGEAAVAQTWTYTHYSPSRRALHTGTLELAEADGKGTVSMLSYHEYADPCYAKKKLPATVVREADYIVVTTPEVVRGCPAIRLKIRNDGTGGAQELFVNGAWAPDNLDHGLQKK